MSTMENKADQAGQAGQAIDGWYFDGKTSRKHRVRCRLVGPLLQLQGDVVREQAWHQLTLSERTKSGPRKVYFPDGAHLEVPDGPAFAAMLQAHGHVDSEVVRMQQSWRGTVLALFGTVLILAAAYLYGLPALAKMIANSLPASVERTLGKESLGFMDKALMAPSKLPEAKKQALVQRFRGLAARQVGAPHYEIVFRKSKIGPNAFALPSGQIILTDEIIKLVGDDEDAVMGILAHELGHLHQRHMTRRIIQSGIIAAVGTTLFGDVSSVVANIPTLLGDLKYSRDVETEADDYAIALFRANGIELEALARVFEKLGQYDGRDEPDDKARKEGKHDSSGKDGSQDQGNASDPANQREQAPKTGKVIKRSAEPPGYLSTHPPSAERVARIRRAQRGS